MEDKQRICEICNKRFANGKAMGGHMRSHMAKLPLATKTFINTTQTPLYSSNFMSTPPPPWPPKTAPPSSSSSVVSAYRWSSTSSHPHFISMINHRSLDDSHEPAIPRRRRRHHKSPSLEGDSDTDSSPRNPTRKRSQRRRRLDSPPFGFSDDEEVAMCLMKLSRDKWTTKTEIRIMKPVVGEDDDDDEDQAASVSRRRRTYKCETCNKLFRSYQALGGHRASHKHKKLKLCFDDNYDHNNGDYDDLLDLNFLPEEEEELSTVSNADFR